MKLKNPRWSKEVRRDLRQRQTSAEECLWQHLRINSSQLGRVNRQVGLGRYVVDFLHKKTRLVIEVDGAIHLCPENKAYDHERTVWLVSNGYNVIRFTNDEVLADPVDVLLRIDQRITFLFYERLQWKRPQPLPIRGAGGVAAKGGRGGS